MTTSHRPGRVFAVVAGRVLLAALLPVAILAASADCSSDSGPCTSDLGQIDSAVSTATTSRSTCTVDSDCTALTPIVTCSGSSSGYKGCPLAVNAATSAKLLADIKATTADFCSRSCGTTTAVCSGASSPRCLSGACAMVKP